MRSKQQTSKSKGERAKRRNWVERAGVLGAVSNDLPLARELTTQCRPHQLFNLHLAGRNHKIPKLDKKCYHFLVGHLSKEVMIAHMLWKPGWP